ncbi:hypothetical protein A2U01_0035409, partial [Trifolium medium]|nr:hypothetical protein [Trifolium medium]
VRGSLLQLCLSKRSLLYVILEQRKSLAVVLEQGSPKLASLGKEVLG